MVWVVLTSVCYSKEGLLCVLFLHLLPVNKLHFYPNCQSFFSALNCVIMCVFIPLIFLMLLSPIYKQFWLCAIFTTIINFFWNVSFSKAHLLCATLYNIIIIAFIMFDCYMLVSVNQTVTCTQFSKEPSLFISSLSKFVSIIVKEKEI